jgi:hypothetical protein
MTGFMDGFTSEPSHLLYFKPTAKRGGQICAQIFLSTALRRARPAFLTSQSTQRDPWGTPLAAHNAPVTGKIPQMQHHHQQDGLLRAA